MVSIARRLNYRVFMTEDKRSPIDACTMGKARHSTLRGEFWGEIYEAKTFQRPADDTTTASESDLDSDEENSRESALRRKMRAKRKRKADALDAESFSFNRACER